MGQRSRQPIPAPPEPSAGCGAPAEGPLARAVARGRTTLLRWWYVAALWIVPLERVIRMMRARPVRAGGGPSPALLRYLVARLDSRIARRGPGGRPCLPRSLLLCTLLREAGHDPVLNIGLSLQGGRLGHAWVSMGAEAVWEKSDEWRGFSVLVHSADGVAYWTEPRLPGAEG